MHAKLACLGYLCHHGPQKWTLPILIELFSAYLNFRTELADFILPVVAHLGVTEAKRWGSWNGGKTEQKEPSAEQRVWCMKKNASHSTHAHMWSVFSALQVQCAAAALPCMPGAWIISPFRRGAIKAYGEYNSRMRRRVFGLDGWGRQRRQNAGESSALVMNLNLYFGPSLNLFFFK